MRQRHARMIATDLPAAGAVVESAVTGCRAGRGAEVDEGGEDAQVDVGVEQGEEEEVWGGDGGPGAGADGELCGVVSG